MALQHPFRPALFRFLRDLAANNRRDWFDARRDRFEKRVRGPALAFVEAAAPAIHGISPHLVADPRRQGGSIFRIHRDLRFARDKRPYKTSLGIGFFHDWSREVDAPGFYLYLEPGATHVLAGLRRPDATTARAVRQAMVEDPAAWKRAIGNPTFRRCWRLAGDKLARPPRGFDPDHPLAEDLRRKEFVARADLRQSQVTSPYFDREFGNLCRAGAPLVRFLCEVLELPF